MPRTKVCMFQNCKSNSVNNPEKKFFTFPSTRTWEWRNACGNTKRLNRCTDLTLSKRCFVCSDHFLPEDFRMILPPFNTRLLPNALPKDLDISTIPNKDAKETDDVTTLLNENNEILPQISSVNEVDHTSTCITEDKLNDSTEYILSEIETTIEEAKKKSELEILKAQNNDNEEELNKHYPERKFHANVQLINYQEHNSSDSKDDIDEQGLEGSNPMIEIEKLYHISSKPVKIEVTAEDQEGICIVHNDPINKPEMISEGTQCDLIDYEENAFSIFCCTFYYDNEVETFCHLNNKEIPLIKQPYQIEKFPKSYRRKHGRKRAKSWVVEEETHLKTDENIEIKFYGTNDTEHYINNEGLVIEVSEIKKEDSIQFNLDGKKSYSILDNNIDLLAVVNPSTKMKSKIKSDISNKKRKRNILPADLCKLCVTRSDQFLCRRVAIHSNKEFYCKYCNEYFDNLIRLDLHVNEHHPSEVKKFLCEYCNQSFSCEYKKFRHTSPYKCKLCEDVFYCFSLLKFHKKAKHFDQVQIAYQCHQCLQHFVSDKKFSIHTKYIKCSLCDNIYNCRTQLRNHRYTNHEKICHLCTKEFRSYQGFRKHILSHSEKTFKKYHCEVCSKGFSSKQFLANHMRIHTGERPYLCDTCGATFTQTGSLYTHVHGVHGVYKNVIKEDGSSEVQLVKRKYKKLYKSSHHTNLEEEQKKSNKKIVHVIDGML